MRETCLHPCLQKRASHLWNDLRRGSLTEYTLVPCAIQAPCLVVPSSYSCSAKYVTSVVKITPVHAYTVVLKIQNLSGLLYFLVVSLHTLFLIGLLP